MDEISKPPGIIITKMQSVHLDDLAQLERLTFSRPWSYDALAEELQNPLAVFFVAQSPKDKQAVGYIGMHHILDEGAIANIVVHPDYRRIGIAKALIAAAVDYAEQNRLSRLTLEVRVSNLPAVALYEGMGFKRDGIRPDFYDSPKEDAAIYSLYF
ncbi:MAG: ribosomal protein S18-alanine N-acetyltransferase [Oscillospiraceae bacterium]|nr:ribosomal protein S18-alanine N-acetyltransferase [Oscillospiraceae bacterium]MDD4413008.1 ribosomal protein S18-alanine N-acetyltransferase [Oscillospiraceae bacterium]